MKLDEGTEDIEAAIGKQITGLEVDEDACVISLASGERLRIWDDGQDCCERRYITCDDNVSGFDGARLVAIEARDVGPEQPPGDDAAHDVVFVVIETDRGAVTLCTHNEHNGYYGGFHLRAQLSPAAPAAPKETT